MPEHRFRRSALLPVGTNLDTGGIEPAVPGIVMDAIDAAKVPGDVYAGRRAATPEAAGQMALGLGLGGSAVARPGSLGMFGRKASGETGFTLRDKAFARYPAFNEGLPTSKAPARAGVINRQFDVDGTTGESFVHLFKDPVEKGKVNATVDFFVDGVETGMGPIVQKALDTQKGRKILNQVMSDVREIIAASGAKEISFQSGRPELDSLYNIVAKRIAKETGGKVEKDVYGDFIVKTGESFQKKYQSNKATRELVAYQLQQDAQVIPKVFREELKKLDLPDAEGAGLEKMVKGYTQKYVTENQALPTPEMVRRFMRLSANRIKHEIEQIERIKDMSIEYGS